MDSSIGILEGAATSSPTEPETSVGSGHERDKCGQRLANESTLKSDLVVHTSKEQHICNLCHHEFATWLEFVAHKCTRSGEKPYACELCPARFSHRKGMDKHRRLHASGVDLYNCPKCGMAFRHMKILQRHLVAHDGAKPHVCHLCPASFRMKYNLQDHLLQHTVEKPHTCSMCKKAFRWRWGLQEHIRRTHGGVKTAVPNAECSVDVTTPSSPLPTPPSDQLTQHLALVSLKLQETSWIATLESLEVLQHLHLRNPKGVASAYTSVTAVSSTLRITAV